MSYIVRVALALVLVLVLMTAQAPSRSCSIQEMLLLAEDTLAEFMPSS